MPHQQPPPDRQFEPQLELGRPPSWLIPYPCVPYDNAAVAAAYHHSFSTNVASAQATESTTAARGLAASPKTNPSGLIHARQDRATVSHPQEGSSYHRPGRADAAWPSDRPRPATEASGFAGHLHGMSAAPLHPLKQVNKC